MTYLTDSDQIGNLVETVSTRYYAKLLPKMNRKQRDLYQQIVDLERSLFDQNISQMKEWSIMKKRMDLETALHKSLGWKDDDPAFEGIPEFRDRVVSRAKSAYSYVNRQLKRLPPWAPWAIGGAAAVGVLLLVTRKASASRGAAVNVPEGEFERLINARGLDRKVVKAIMNVEASGSPFSAPGKPIVRFEPHVFLRYSAAWKLSDGKRLPDRHWPTSAETQANGITILLPGMSAPTRAEGKKRRGGQPAEWDAISRAASALNRTVAIMSASWGIGQVMGFNYKLLGYANPLDMEASFSASAEAQKVGMLNFLTNSGLSEAIKNRDWMKIGRVYNGDTTGHAAANYKAAYDKLT